MASESFVQPAIPRFDGHYDHWSMLMENFLRSKEYWTVVVSGVAEPAKDAVLTDVQKAELEAVKLKDLKAKNYLFQAIDRSILETILCKETAKHIWDSMKKKYQGTARARRQQLQALHFDGENEDGRQQLVENEQQPVPATTEEEERPQRARRRPAWMTDYEFKGGIVGKSQEVVLVFRSCPSF
ncbi:hypothetical protein Vadar_023364 [Vaccinium darrowii]|uniref:Uncharacterized protein n=1 Tax=Vaccinium darrowii TaxID=229202 RepID=A0ACB7XTB4_9ERIC|nr:hypothetical protein Vadar_023364 [Vaccinium darrowii]